MSMLVATPRTIPQKLDDYLYQIEQYERFDPAIYFRKNKAVNERAKKELERYQQKKANAEALATQLQKNAEKKAKMTQELNENKRKVARTRISRTKVDEAFSLCIRLRSNCTCERCGLEFAVNNMKYLHCSHNYGRAMKNIRYHPLNAFALCKDCHWWFAKSKTASTAWFKEKLGDEKLNQLRQDLAQLPEPTASEEEKIKAYYSLLSRQILRLREQGNTDYLDFLPYHQALAIRY